MNKTPLYRFAAQLAYVRCGILRRKQLGDIYADMSYRTIRGTVNAFIRTMFVGATQADRESIRLAFRTARADYESLEVPRG